MEIQEFIEKIIMVGAALKMSVEFPSVEDMRWQKWAYLKKDYQKIRMSNEDYQNEHKIHIVGDFPKSVKGEPSHYGEPISINISASKTADQIARDIERRFLSIYLLELEKATYKVQETNDYHLRRKRNIQELADYFQVEFKNDDREPSIYVYGQIKGLGSRIEAYGKDTVKFDLELTPEMAIKVFDLLKK